MKNFLTVLLSTLVGVLLSEIAYRTILISSPRSPLGPVHISYPNPYLDYVPSPNHTGQGALRFNKDKHYTFSINANGVRGPSLRPLLKGCPRILILGDSYTFGEGVSDGEVFSRMAEQRLKEEYKFCVEIVNGGVSGYNSVQSLHRLKELLPGMRPQGVILEYTPNDTQPPSRSHPKAVYHYAYSWVWEDLMFHLLHNRPSFRRRLGIGLRKLGNDGYLNHFEEDRWNWRASKDAVTEMAGICRENGLSFQIIQLPDFTKSFKKYPYHIIHSAVDVWAKELGIDVTDYYPFFQGEDSKDYSLFEDGHPNARAHEKIGAHLADQIFNTYGKNANTLNLAVTSRKKQN